MPKIRVMIIDDSLVFRTFLKQRLSSDPMFDVVGAFGDPVEAKGRIGDLRPDVLAVDMEMPRLRGDEFLRQAVAEYPGTKAIMMSSLSGNVFDAMQAGAIDFVGKPGSSPGYGQDQFTADILQMLKIAATARVKIPLSTAARQAAPSAAASRGRPSFGAATSRSLIAIGASTGGTEAILDVIRNFPKSTPGIVIVQHMPPTFTKMYAERIDKICPMSVREAKHMDRVETGLVLIAPGGDKQMTVKNDGRGYYVHLADGPKVSGHCPSVDVMFESVSKCAGRDAVGVLLTGMGADGAKGLLAMRNNGAHTIGQNEATCIVYGMPKVAYDLGGVVEQLALPQIGDAIMRRFAR